MGNEGQHYKPLSQQGIPEQPQQPYYGWQYDGEPSAPPEAPIPVVPSQHLPSVQGLPPTSPAQAQFRGLRAYGTPSGPLAQPQQVVPPQYQDALLDMGSSLGYGQGMEYQYFNAPQPSQSMPVLHQKSRLEQLRAERMNRFQPGTVGPHEAESFVSGNGKKISFMLSKLFRPSDSSPTSSPWETRTRMPVPPPPLLGTPPTTVSSRLPAMPVPPPPIPGGRPPVISSRLPALPGGTPPPVGVSLTPPPAGPATLPPILQRGPSGLPLSLASRPLPAMPAPQEPVSGPSQPAFLTSATLILSGSFIIGRILGLVRTSMFAFIFGAGALSDAYLQAFLLPDLIFSLIAGGALSSAFIPVFTYYMFEKKDEATAWRIASSVLNLVMAVLCLIALLAIILAPSLVPLFNPHVDSSEMALIVSLTRLMLVQSIIMGGGVIINSVLYARQKFLLPALGTVLYHAGLIIGLLPGFFLVFAGRSSAHLSFAVYGATWGVVLGALLQVGIQIPGIVQAKMHYTPILDWKHPGVRRIARQMLPRVANAALLYLSTFVDRFLILLLAAAPLFTEPGLITQYYLALQLVLLPLGIFGMTVSTAAFPTLSENVLLGQVARVRAVIEDTLRSILFLSIPTSVVLIILGVPIIQVLLQHGAFNLDNATGTSVPLAFFAVGLSGLAAVEILTRSFYAFRDSKTPVLVSMAQFMLKILLSLLLLNLVQWGPSWRLGALALATSLAGLLEAGVLLWLLQKKVGLLNLNKLAVFAGRVVLAALIMAGALLLLRTFLDVVLITTTSPTLGFLGSIFAVLKLLFEALAGLLVYIWATRLLGLEDFWKQGPLRRVLERFKLSWE